MKCSIKGCMNPAELGCCGHPVCSEHSQVACRITDKKVCSRLECEATHNHFSPRAFAWDEKLADRMLEYPHE